MTTTRQMLAEARRKAADEAAARAHVALIRAEAEGGEVAALRAQLEAQQARLAELEAASGGEAPSDG